MNILQLIKGINLSQLLAMDDHAWMATLRVRGTAVASKTTPIALTISSDMGYFLALFMTGRFFTKEAGPVDNGICQTSIAISNGSGRIYIPDPIYMDQLFTPGRVKSLAASGAAGGVLQFPGIEWVQLFRPTDVITHNVTNDAAVDNDVEIAYRGLWLK